jgi:FMN reductase
MHQLVISCSLKPTSRSAVMARALAEAARRQGDDAGVLDLRELDLPFCDAADCYAHPSVLRLQEAVAAAGAVALATPIYNYEVGGATRNLVALAGEAWDGKVVGFVCAAGGQASYMAVMGLATSLMLDFRCVIVPRFVYATGAAFEGGRLTDPEVMARIEELARTLHRFGEALGAPPRP